MIWLRNCNPSVPYLLERDRSRHQVHTVVGQRCSVIQQYAGRRVEDEKRHPVVSRNSVPGDKVAMIPRSENAKLGAQPGPVEATGEDAVI